MSELEIYKGMVKKMKNDEIKNILDKLNNCKWEKDTAEITYKILFGGEVYKLLDYITNLQQENEMLKQADKNTYETSQEIMAELTRENERLKERISYLERSNNRREDTIMGLRYEINSYEDYKSRCERTNKELINSKEYQMAIAMELNDKQSILIKLDNILNGRSDE